jgi:RNA polymerase sigma-70 factor (ECF subfamily)
MAMHAERPESGAGKGALWQEYGDAVGRVCTALLGDAAAAQAAVEEVFVAALAGGAARSQGATMRGWLFGIARGVCARRLETGATQESVVHTQRIPGAPPVPARAPKAKDEHEGARLALAELRPTERDAVVLWRVGGLSTAEIAQACNTDEATARARVSKGLARLRASLGDDR